MSRFFLLFPMILLSFSAFAQERSLELFLSDSSMLHASVSFSLIDAESGNAVMEYHPEKSLAPASILKLVTSAAALEMLGPDYTFSTFLGYAGTLHKRSGKLEGNIIIRGGGDPSLGSDYFPDYYGNFLNNWASEIKRTGINKISGRVIADDSYYDFLPVPAKWLWEDAGNYYGAGVYGLSVFDNEYEIHLKTDSSQLVIKDFVPPECSFEFTNWLTAAGTSDQGYVFAAPYSTNGWLAGTVPSNMDDFVLKASVTDPPLLVAKMMNERLEGEGIRISEEPSTLRLKQKSITGQVVQVTETISPPLAEIIKVLNHESVNLYAEHLLKELGKKFRNTGSTVAGVEVVKDFLFNAGINIDGMFIEDGSGLSPLNSINTKELAQLLFYMKSNGKYFSEYYSSLPEAGKEGTLKNYFKDPVFDGNLKAKSGSMTRVRSYAGYFTTMSGKEMIFCIIVNNFSGPSKNIVSRIEELLKEIILNK